MTKNEANELAASLKNFTGTNGYTKHWCGGVILLTDGAKYLAEKAGAFWLMDIVASVKAIPARKDTFHTVTLTKNKNGNGAKVVIDNGNGRADYTQRIPFTDFPLDSVKMFFTDGVLMLASEY